MNREELAKRLESMKGLAGSGNVLSEVIRRSASDYFMTMEPGDIVRTLDGTASAAPIAHDLWYLNYHQNFMRKYYTGGKDADYKFYDYTPYLENQLSFLNYLPGLKPLRVFTDLEAQFSVNDLRFESVWSTKNQYDSKGIYWINTLFFEFIINKTSLKYPSDGSKGYQANVNKYAGYIAFPVGQLGVMEVISLVQETELRGYAFANYSGNAGYHDKAPLSNLDDKYKPAVQNTPEMFPDMKDSNGNVLAGQNYCYGRHLIEDAYYKPEKPVDSQNTRNSVGATAYAPTAELDVELWASNIKDYGEDMTPKKWMRYWIHKDSTLPVPGEFIGILCRPVACAPHVWWFQKSSPLLYAGNWMDTKYLTSGVITGITLEASRTDKGTGDEYRVRIQGVEVTAYASDFYRYSVGDRVAVLKKSSLGKATESYTSMNQAHFKESDGVTISLMHMIIPATFYKIKH
jgi:hypothetical protein